MTLTTPPVPSSGGTTAAQPLTGATDPEAGETPAPPLPEAPVPAAPGTVAPAAAAPDLTDVPAPREPADADRPRVRAVLVEPPQEPDTHHEPGEGPRLGAVPVAEPPRTAADRRRSLPAVRAVRLADGAAPAERPVTAVTPVPLPLTRPGTSAEATGTGTGTDTGTDTGTGTDTSTGTECLTGSGPAGVAPSRPERRPESRSESRTEIRTEEPQP
ncbi:hypothetical protein [Streptomyces sp. NPDC003327]